MPELTIRPRVDADLAALADMLGRQQAETRYPMRWPWPGPVEDFIRRPHELEAWVAMLDDGVVGHVSLTTVGDDDLGRLGSAAHGVTADRLRCVSVLFADRRLPRRGIGSALLAHATERALTGGGAPVLDVVAGHVEPVRLYESRGWVDAGRFRPDWLPASEEAVRVMIRPRSSTVESCERERCRPESSGHDEGRGTSSVSRPS